MGMIRWPPAPDDTNPSDATVFHKKEFLADRSLKFKYSNAVAQVAACSSSS